MIISKLISNNVQTALVWQIGSRKVFQFPDKKVLLTLRLYEISLNYRGQRYIKISKTPKDKGKIHKQKKARGNASLYYHPTWKPSAESTAVSVVRAMLMITDHLFFASFVITISSE